MPRPTPSTFGKTADGRITPASPRWGRPHGSGSSQGSPSAPTLRSGQPTSRRGVTAVSSPRANPLPGHGGAGTRGFSARDPQGLREGSIGSNERVGKPRQSIESENTDGGREETREDSGRIRVAVRVRPFSEKEKMAGTRCVISMSGNQTKILDPAYFDSEDGANNPDDRSMWERTFSFDHSFWSHSSGEGRGIGGGAAGTGGGRFSSQADVHQALGNFLLDNACRGYNCSLFAYGQTGSGKTYTMLGNSSDLTSAAGEGTAGLIPRICVELFQRFGLAGGGRGSAGGANNAFRGNGQASIQVSFCEIYNEQVRDLFGHVGGGHGLRVREHPTKGAFVEGLSARPVASYQQVQQLLEDGMASRATAATAMNEVSSRSHAIFTIHITVTVTTKLSHGGGQGGKGEAVDSEGEAENDVSSRTSKICLVDLAGSERANATGAKGDRLREAANINKSLSTLGDVIKALAKKASSGRGGGGGGGGGSLGAANSNNESFIPYRNSMLTWLLKDSIGGNSKTVMLAAISPVADAYQETMSTLRYVERAKEIVNSVAINDANANPLVGKLREEVRALQELLEVKDAAIAEHEGKEAMLTAALDRARTGDDDKVLRALEDADRLEAALQAERRDREKAEATAAKEAEADKRRHERELEDQVKRHSADFEGCLARHQEELTRAKDEAAQMLTLEVGLVKDHAAEERRALRAEWEEAAERERAKAAEATCKEQDLAAELGRHRAESERALKEAADAAARAAEAAKTEMRELRESHAAEIAKSAKSADAAAVGHADELRCLREEFEKEKETLQKEASDARDMEIAKRDAEQLAKMATAAAAADETREAALKEVRDQYEEALISLSESHGLAVRAAVEEAEERLRAAHNGEVEAARAAGELASREASLEEAAKSEEDYAKKLDAAIAALNADHEGELAKLRSEHEVALEKARGDAEVGLATERETASAKIAEVQGESARTIKALKESHREQLASAGEEHNLELRRATEAARTEAKAMLAAMAAKSAAEIEALKVEAEAARDVQEQKHREEVRAVGEQLEAEIKVLVADSEHREREALEALGAEHEASMAETKAKFDQLIGRMEAEHRESLAAAEERRQNDQRAAATAAEERRAADVEGAELRAAGALAAAQEGHREEICRMEKESEARVSEARAATEQKRASDLATTRETLSRSLVDAQREHEATVAALKTQHGRELDLCETRHRGEVERLVAEAEGERQAGAAAAAKSSEQHDELASALAAVKAETAAAAAEVEAQHQERMRRSQQEHEAEIGRVREAAERRREEDLAALRLELDRAETSSRSMSDAVREQSAAHKEEMEAAIAARESAHQAELEGLREEHAALTAAAAAKADRRRTAEIADAESRYKSAADAARQEMAEEKAKFVSRHLLELRKVKEEGARELERACREAAERSAAQEAKAAADVNEAKAAHLRDLQAASASAEEARKAELAAVNDTLASTTSKLKLEADTTTAKLMEHHQAELRKVSEELEAEHGARAAAAAELHAKALLDANATHEKQLQDALEAERSSHAAAITELEAALAAADTEAKNRLQALDSEHRAALDAREEAHRAAMEELEESRDKGTKELQEQLEAAQAAAADAQDSADELATRADALDEMLKASVGSNEQELAGHRSRVAQLQGFVARREAALAPSASGDEKSCRLSPAATRSLQQRITDLRAMAVGAGASGLKNTGSRETSLSAFASTGLVEGLTIEKYSEELEAALIRATVETAAARQDHLEADLQCQSVTRQLVGLKLVHAQLRECLEDTQVKLEHKSQSAARRLLNSAARLAYEFAKPDRFSSPRHPGSPSKSTKPRAMSRQSSGGRSPLSRTRGVALRRNKTPDKDRKQDAGGGASKEQVVVDFSATL